MKSMEIEPASSIAKGTSSLATIRIVKWRRDPQNYPIIKEIVTNSNKDAIVLQARGRELEGDYACLSCKAGFGPFLSCGVFFKGQLGLRKLAQFTINFALIRRAVSHFSCLYCLFRFSFP